MNTKRQLLMTSLFLIAFVFVAGTLAYWIWSSDESEATAISTKIVGQSSCSILVDGGGEIDASNINMVPSTCDDESATIVKEINISVQPAATAKDVFLELFLSIDRMGDALKKSENFRYVLSKSKSCYTDIVNSGSFKYADNGMIKLLSDTYMTFSTNPVTDKYYLYIWLDEKETDANTAGNEFTLSLTGSCGDTELSTTAINRPVLDDGLIPVTIADNGTVTSVSSTSSSWYNYDNKQWANAVLVSDGNSSTSAYDLSGNNTSNTISGATKNMETGGLVFDGTDDYVRLPVISIAQKSAFSVEVDFSVDSLSSEQEFILTNVENGGFGIKYIGGQLTFQIYDAALDDYVRVSTDENFLTPGERYTATGIYDGNFVIFYVDGEFIGRAPIENIADPEDSSNVVMLGCNPFGSDCVDEYFAGTIYSAKFYNKALSGDEILKNYNKDVIMSDLLFYFDFENGKRVLYKNVSGQNIPESEILAYYVWIPKYSYRIPAGSGPRTIDIQFDSTNTTMIDGDAVNTYRTHPAFWWDYNSDGVVNGGEVIPGFWAGKFETTGTETEPTIKPKGVSLSSLEISNQFATSLKFAGGTQIGSSVNFVGNNTYGLSSSVDSHMMKNSEWGAVAYLTHSFYGINGKVTANNNENNYTGCGQATSTRKCINSFGSLTDGNYLQSTTGNISGIFDMAGGSWEYVMGNYNNIASSSGFTVLPSSKYLNIYSTLQSDCSIESCGGHALFEVYGWNDLMLDGDDETTSNVWYIRGGSWEWEEESDVLSFDLDDGFPSAWGTAFRSVLIPDVSNDSGSSIVNATVTATNNFANKQTVTVSWTDDVVAYYWGTQHPYSTSVTWNNASGNTANFDVVSQGTYYLGVKDSNNVITVIEKEFYMTDLILSNVTSTLSTTKVLTMKGNKINLPTLTPISGYTFLGWYTGVNATGEKLNKTYTPKGSSSIYAYTANKLVTVNYYVDGGTVTPSTFDESNSYSWTQDSSGLLSLNGTVYNSVFGYDEKLSFPSNTNTKFLNITKQYYGVDLGAEWACVSGCTSSGMTFNINETYNVADVCDITQDSCVINLKVNWKLGATVINANRFTTVTANSLKRLVVFYVTMCDDGICEYTKKYGLTSSYSASRDFEKTYGGYSGTIAESKISSSVSGLGVKTYTYYAKASNGCRVRADKDYDTGMYSFPSGCKSYTFYLTGYLSTTANTTNDNSGIYRYMWYNTKSCYVWRNNLYTSSSC